MRTGYMSEPIDHGSDYKPECNGNACVAYNAISLLIDNDSAGSTKNNGKSAYCFSYIFPRSSFLNTWSFMKKPLPISISSS
jgi:hypothetical protein